MKQFIYFLFFILVFGCSTNMFLENKTYKISHIEGEPTDVQKLFFMLGDNQLSNDSLYFRYEKDAFNNCYIYSGNNLASAFKIKKDESEKIIAENYFPIEEMGYSYRDSNRFQYQLNIEKDNGKIRLVFDNLEDYDSEWAKNNQLNQKLIIEIESN
ncbi:MAG: hypothetical protein H3C39_08605 [Flavobacteriia bacterium]|nr:hypothetical protein [Flavobacteriia bacterium]